MRAARGACAAGRPGGGESFRSFRYRGKEGGRATAVEEQSVKGERFPKTGAVMTGLSPTGAARRGMTNWLEPNRPQDVMDYQLGTETWQETESKPQPGQREDAKAREERTDSAGGGEMPSAPCCCRSRGRCPGTCELGAKGWVSLREVRPMLAGARMRVRTCEQVYQRGTPLAANAEHPNQRWAAQEASLFLPRVQ